MSATGNTTRRGLPLPGLRGFILGGAAFAALAVGLPHSGHAQGLDRLFNRAAETQATPAADPDADMSNGAGDEWGLEVTSDEARDPTTPVARAPLSLDGPAASGPALVPAADPDQSGPQDPLREELEREIDARMRAITERIGNSRPIPEADTLTVEDLDSIQRDAQRAAATQTLKEAEYQGIREEIEMLLYLQNTLTELQQARGQTTQAAPSAENGATPAATPAVDVAVLRAQWEAEQAASAAAQAQEQANASLAAEQAAIPRLAAIKGAAGVWEAEIESVRGVMQYVAPGDALADGFIVESIDGKGAVIKAGGSGNRYSIIPSPPAGIDASGPQEPAMARDLSQSGGVF